MPRKTNFSPWNRPRDNKRRSAAGIQSSKPAGSLPENDPIRRWMAKYDRVEREIIEKRARLLERRIERNAEKDWFFGGLCEATGGLAKVWRMKGVPLKKMIEYADGDVFMMMCLTGYYGKYMMRKVDRVRHILKRPFYYAAENARRRELAAIRRKTAKRHTVNRCPTREEILDAWIHLKDSHAATIRFGSLIEDLACYVDNELRRNEGGAIVGRNGGVKAWLQENIPALYLRYTTVMRYKATARKLKQIAEISDPTPAEAIVGDKPMAAKDVVEGKQMAAKDVVGNKAVPTDAAVGDKPTEQMHDANRGRDISLELVRAKAIWLEVVTGVRANPTALVARIDALVNPERIEDGAMLAEWREKYKREITVRTKSRWWRRIAKKLIVETSGAGTSGAGTSGAGTSGAGTSRETGVAYA